MNNKASSLALLQCIATGLMELRHEVVFVGGVTTCFYLDDPAAPEPPATDDVDCIIKLSSFGKYYQLEERLRRIGFQNAAEPGAPIGRWLYQGINVDIMPSDPKILGFSNIWYPEAHKHRILATLPDGTAIWILPVTYFLATKLEAFKDRGRDDWALSRDLEDIVAVADGCTSISDALMGSEGELRSYLTRELGTLIRSKRSFEMISAHLPGNKQNEERTERILKILHTFVRR